MRVKIRHKQSFKLQGYSAHKRPWDLSWGSCQLPTWESERRTGRHRPDACVLRALRQRGSERKVIRDGLRKCPKNTANSNPHFHNWDFRFHKSQSLVTLTSSSVSSSLPLTTYALGASPFLASATPITATSVTPSSALIWFSNSAGATLIFTRCDQRSAKLDYLESLNFDQFLLSVHQKDHSILRSQKLFSWYQVKLLHNPEKIVIHEMHHEILTIVNN